MQYVIIAPACNVPLPGTNPKPNQLIMERAAKLATEIGLDNNQITIFTDCYALPPQGLPPGIDFVRGGPEVAISQVMFLRQLRQYLQSLKSDYRLVAVMTPHYVRRFNRDVLHICGQRIPVDPELLGLPISSFVSTQDGGDARSRSALVWLIRELVIEMTCLISWRLYAKLSS